MMNLNLNAILKRKNQLLKNLTFFYLLPPVVSKTIELNLIEVIIVKNKNLLIIMINIK